MKNIIYIALFLLGFSSCSSFLEEYSQDLARVESITDLDELLLGGVYHNAGYTRVENYTFYFEGDGLNIFVNFMSDELQQNSIDGYDDMYSADVFGYYTWQRNVGLTVQGNSVGQEDKDWTKMYEYINTANMIIDELPEVEAADDLEAADKIRIEGEAHFLRALYYFTLVNLYAEPYAPSTAATTPGIPLKTTSYIEDKLYVRNTLAEVYEQILSDLDRAEECLSQSERVSLYRADITATYLLKSRVYLYMQDWENARTYAQNVLDRNNSLIDLRSFNGEDNVFTSSSPEAIFSMGGHFLSYYIYGQDNYPDYVPFFVSEDLANAYSDDDLRKGTYIVYNGYGWTYKKIYWASAHYGIACSVSDNYFFRTSEAYLNLAEAAAMSGDEGTARQMLAQLQAKRFSTVPTISEAGNDLIDLIREERQRELCLEGHRWYDLRRYTVCEKYPWSKSFQHTFYEFGTDSDWNTIITRQRTYELEEFDEAYTLAFPKEVLDFQNTLATNERPERQPISEIDNTQN